MLFGAVLLAGFTHASPVFAEQQQTGDAENIDRLTLYFPDSETDDSWLDGTLGGQVYYSQAPAGEGLQPDRLEAADAQVSPEGLIEANQGTLYITSLVEDETLTAQADYISFDTSTGDAELSGNVVLELEGTDLRLDCEELEYDPLMGQLAVTGLSINLPLEWFAKEGQLGEQQLRANFGDSIYTPLPDNIRLMAAEATLAIDSARREIVVRDVKLSHHTRPDPDLYVHADVLRLTADGFVIIEGFSVHMSGIELFSWPRVSRNLHGRDRPLSLDFPIVRFEKDVGFAWKQGVTVDLKSAQADILLDYAPDYGLLSNFQLSFNPYAGTELGIETGTRSVFDINRVSVERRSDYNLLWRQSLTGDGWFRNLDVAVEYGEIAAFTPAQPLQGIPAQRQEDTRVYGDGQLEFPLVGLGSNLYLTTGAVGRFVEYEDANQRYRVAGAYGGLIFHQNNFDHFVLYRANRIDGEPLFSFDEMRQREVDVMTSFRLHPEWRHVIRGIYDIDDGEFNQLKVSALKKQKTYEIGMFWDFARESAGIEMGLLVD